MSLFDYVFEDRRLAREANKIQRARRRGVAIRGHNAAKDTRLTADWPTMPVPTDTMVKNDLQKLRARSRWEAENDDFASRFLALLETNVIGEPGIRPTPTVVGPDGEPDVAMNEAIALAWEDWGGARKLCDMGGRMTWHDMERLFVRTCAEDGEVLVQEVRGRTAGPYGYALHFIDAELLDINYEEEPGTSGSYSRLGVQLNEWHRPTGYWLKDERLATRPGALYLGSYYSAASKLWSADEILHAFIMRRIGQKRGLPWMSASLFRMRQLAGFEDAASVASRAGASQMGAIEREAGGDDEAYDDQEDGGGPRIVETEPGIWMELRPGEKLSGYTPNYPNEMFAPFVESCLRSISSGLNTSYASLANDSRNTSYSARRADRTDEADAWRLLQRWTAAAFHQRVYRGFLEMAAMSNMIRPVDGRSVGAAEALAMADMVEWDGRGWEAIDHDKESRSNERDVRNGVRSRQEIAGARGRKWMRVLRELAEENRLMKEAGIPVPDPNGVNEEVVRDYLLELMDRDDEEEGQT